MFFIPIGDDIDNRTLPVVGTFILIVCVILLACTIRVFLDKDTPAELRLLFERGLPLVPVTAVRGRLMGFFTYPYLHGGLMHLVGNMLVLWAFCRSLERALGGFAFFVLYTIWGGIAGLSHVIMQPKSDIPLVGASGAIAGVMGAYFVLFGFRTEIKTWIGIAPISGLCGVVKIPAYMFFFIWFGLQIAGVVEQYKPNAEPVAFDCHIAGFLSGVLFMLMVRSPIRNRLVRNKEGQLMFAEDLPEASSSALGVSKFAAANPGRMPEKCHHCSHALGESNLISERLLQCPNCRRLVYY